MPGSASCSSLNILSLLAELRDDWDNEFLCEGLFHGFNIIDPASNLHNTFIQNRKPALEPRNRQLMDRIIRAEINAGNYTITRTKPIIVSALGAVPKSDGQLRPIHDCSLPENGLNAFTPDNEHQSYNSVDDAIHILKPGYFMAEIDIRHGYRSLPISLQTFLATGL